METPRPDTIDFLIDSRSFIRATMLRSERLIWCRSKNRSISLRVPEPLARRIKGWDKKCFKATGSSFFNVSASSRYSGVTGAAMTKESVQKGIKQQSSASVLEPVRPKSTAPWITFSMASALSDCQI